jgi:RNA polymerase sigma factor (sigma-70 family)
VVMQVHHVADPFQPSVTPIRVAGRHRLLVVTLSVGKLASDFHPSEPGHHVMSHDAGHTTKLQRWLDSLRRGHADARNEVIDHACERLRNLTRRMLLGYRKLRRWSETDDVLQNALLRLHRALAEVHPESVRQFYALATTQIRRELIDLSRHFLGPEGQGANHDTDDGEAACKEPDHHGEPDTLEEWTEFHEQVDKLPDEERDVFGLLWYEGLTQPEAASVLNVSLKTVKRRWQSARLQLHRALRGQSPEEGKWCDD